MANMTDQTRVASIMNAILAGGAAPTFPTAIKSRLMTTVGSNTANGTEATSGTCPGYTAGGATMAFGSNSSGSSSNTGTTSWTATGTWTTVTGIELWDTAGTPLRWFQGALTTNITGVVSGDTVSFAASSVVLSAASW